MVKLRVLFTESPRRYLFLSAQRREFLHKFGVILHLNVHLRHTELGKVAICFLSRRYVKIIGIKHGVRAQHHNRFRPKLSSLTHGNAVSVNRFLDFLFLAASNFRKDNRRMGYGKGSHNGH